MSLKSITYVVVICEGPGLLELHTQMRWRGPLSWVFSQKPQLRWENFLAGHLKPMITPPATLPLPWLQWCWIGWMERNAAGITGFCEERTVTGLKNMDLPSKKTTRRFTSINFATNARASEGLLGSRFEFCTHFVENSDLRFLSEYTRLSMIEFWWKDFYHVLGLFLRVQRRRVGHSDLHIQARSGNGRSWLDLVARLPWWE